MKILIPGGAGYLGSILCPMLLARDHEVHAVDIREDAETHLQGCLYHKNFSFTRADFRKPEALKPMIRRAEAILPLAALVGAPRCSRAPEQAWAINFEAIARLKPLLDPKQQVIYPMTNNGYRAADASGLVTEESPWEEASVYTQSKTSAESLLLEHPRTVSLRFASLFGVSPAMRWDLLIHDFAWKAVSEGRLDLYEAGFRRNFLHVRDAAHSICFALEHARKMNGGVWNIVHEAANISKAALAQLIKAKIPGLEINLQDSNRDPDKRDFFVSAGKIRKLGFSTQFSIEDGLRELIPYMKAHAEFHPENAGV